MDNTRRTLILSRTTVIATLATAFALVLGTALLSAFTARDMARTDQLGERAKQAVSATTQLLATLASAEAAMTAEESGSPASAGAFAAARRRLHQEVLALPVTLDDRPDLQPQFDQLAALTRNLEQSASQLPAHAEPAETAIVLTQFADVRRLLFGLHRQEFAALVDHSEIAAARARRIQVLTGGVVVFAIALAAAGVWVLANRRRELEGPITVCAWTRRVQWQGRWISFEDYMAQRFNLRCTHGICDEAAKEMRDEVTKTDIPADLRHG